MTIHYGASDLKIAQSLFCDRFFATTTCQIARANICGMNVNIYVGSKQCLYDNFIMEYGYNKQSIWSVTVNE